MFSTFSLIFPSSLKIDRPNIYTVFFYFIAALLMDIMVLDNKEIEKKVFKPVIMKFLMVFNFLKTGCSLNNIYNIK